jgi:tetratricopeptide (TPR) repeat protein
MDAGQIEQAINTAQPIARNVGSDLGVNAAMLLAAAHEATRNTQQAEETYQRVGNGGRFLFQRQEALDNLARMRLQRGDAAGAIQIYERVVSMTPEENPDRQVFEMRLGEARARAVSASASQPESLPPAAGAPAAGSSPAPQPGTEAPAGPQPPEEGATPPPAG